MVFLKVLRNMHLSHIFLFFIEIVTFKESLMPTSVVCEIRMDRQTDGLRLPSNPD